MKLIKSILLQVLGERRYLQFLSKSFWILSKYTKMEGEHQDIPFLKSILRSGDYCLDIGAHLGYFTFQMSKLVGKEGKVIAIEPVSKFHSVIEKMIRSKNLSNIVLHNIALGGEGEFVEIGIPKIDNKKKYGYARIKKLSEHLEYAESEMVTNLKGDELLANLPRLDFIKCDVEGAEVPVFQSMTEVLDKHRPILLCELADQNERIKFFQLVSAFEYELYVLRNGKLVKISADSQEKGISHNHYFIPAVRKQQVSDLINS